MTRRGKTRYPGPEGMLALSVLCHALVFLLVLKLQLMPHRSVETPSYYVDLVTLPVASPQAGTPAPPAPAAADESAPQEPAAAPPLPPPAAPKGKQKTAPPPAATGKGPAPARDETREFTERMERLAQAAEDKRFNDALSKVRKGGGKVGIPGGKGTEAGSDYSSYIQSRLRDAFRSTIASESSAPRVTVRLTIGPDGRIARYRLEQTSGDRVFEEAVERAVHLAEKSFTPPPAGGQFEQGFVFKPQGVGIR